jgi:hypothetical protein
MVQNNGDIKTSVNSKFLGFLNMATCFNYEGLSEPNNPPVVADLTVLGVRFVQPPVFRLYRMKVRHLGTFPRDSVGLPYISALLAMNFTTPELPIFIRK